MTNRLRGGGTWGVAIGAVVVLLGMYVGAYYATVESVELFRDNAGRPVITAWHDWFDRHKALHRGLLESPWEFFAPTHWLDRRIRPHVWEP